MLKLTKQQSGYKFIIGVQGETQQEILDFFNSCYNWGATNGSLLDLGNENSLFKYFFVDSWNKLRRAFFQAEISKMYQSGEINETKGKKEECKKRALHRAENRLSLIKDETILEPLEITIKLHKLGEIEDFNTEISSFLTPYKTLNA